jgi:hypothetical protein
MQSRLAVGGKARVVAGRTNRLRAQPNQNGELLGELPAGLVLSVLDGPECVAGVAWWQVQYSITSGWTAEGQSGTYWLEPLDAILRDFTLPQIRTFTPPNAVLLTGGVGLTDGAPQGPGEFQVEWYCNQQGYGIGQDEFDWFCLTDSGERATTLGIADFDVVCQTTYSNPRAFAIQDGFSPTPAFRWRCYGYR